MKEWTSPYNPFNSMKVLLWRKQLEGIAKGKFLPPVVVDTDPTNKCNLDCIWCNASKVRKAGQHTLSEEHLIRLADFYQEWGVKSTCVSGGGEPLCNPAYNAFLERLHENGIEIGTITNGTLMTDRHIDTIARTARWCGFSVDAATNETYMKVKGITNDQLFERVLRNITRLSRRIKQLGTNCTVGFKFLLHPYNAHEVFDAIKKAKIWGANDFHLRPVGWDNIDITKDKDPIYLKELVDFVNEQIKEGRKLESDKFHIYGITHKFNPDMSRKVNFSKCLATPLLATFGADGNCYLCFDQRGNEKQILCKHDPDPKEILKVWGTQFHKDMINKIDPEKCPRCTFGAYNEIIEQVFIEDNMCRNHI